MKKIFFVFWGLLKKYRFYCFCHYVLTLVIDPRGWRLWLADYHDKSGYLYFFSNPKQSTWAEAAEKYRVAWVDLHAPGLSKIAAKYKVNGIPHQVVISPEGVVLGMWSGYGEGYLRKQLKKHIPGIE